MIQWLKKILKHKHKWKFEPTAFAHGGMALVNDCDNVPLVCKCGAKAKGNWRIKEGLVDIEEENGDN